MHIVEDDNTTHGKGEQTGIRDVQHYRHKAGACPAHIRRVSQHTIDADNHPRIEGCRAVDQAYAHCGGRVGRCVGVKTDAELGARAVLGIDGSARSAHIISKTIAHSVCTRTS